METVTVAELLDFFNGARPDAPVFLDVKEWNEVGGTGHILEYVLREIRKAKMDDIDAL
jgi:hypothetical protein